MPPAFHDLTVEPASPLPSIPQNMIKHLRRAWSGFVLTPLPLGASARLLPALLSGSALLVACLPGRGFAATGANVDESVINRIVYVNASYNGANGSSNGTSSRPYTKIADAFSWVKSNRPNTPGNGITGIKVSIAPGVYRENTAGAGWALGLYNLGGNTPFVIEGQGNVGDVVISGSEIWSGGWTNQGGGKWTRSWPYTWGIPARGTGFPEATDAFLRYEYVHINGKTVYQINPPAPYTNVSGNPAGEFEGNTAAMGSLTADEGAFWVVEGSPGTITIQLPASFPADYDLNAQTVEVTTKRGALQIHSPTPITAATNVVLRNLTFQHFSGTWALLVQNQNNFLMEDCRFLDNKRGAFLVLDVENHTSRRVESVRNGDYGAGYSYIKNGLVEDSKYNQNSRQAEIVGFHGYSICGLKMMYNTDLVFNRCEASDNRATGFWWDGGNLECELNDSVMANNTTNGTFIENNSSVGNSYNAESATGYSTEGIPDLGTRPTVTVRRCIIRNSRPAAGTESYRKAKGRGIWFSETENAVIEDNLIYNNEIQIGTYDNWRAENRRFTFANNVIAGVSSTERLYAVGSDWDSVESWRPRKRTGTGTDGKGTYAFIDDNLFLKGGWYGLYDGLSATTNGNSYFYPNTAAFPERGARYGTSASRTTRPYEAPTRTFAQWQADHLANANNAAANRAVDADSRFVQSTYDGRPMILATAKVASLQENSPATAAFTITRVSPAGYGSALTVNYTVRANTGDATNGSDFATLSGSVTIPANQRSVDISVTPVSDFAVEGNEQIALRLDDLAGSAGYVYAGRRDATVTLTDNANNAPPTSFNVTLQTATAATFTWSDNSTNETGFTIEYRVNGGSWQTLKTVAANTTSTTATLSAGASYEFRLSATNAVTASTVATASVATPAGDASVLARYKLDNNAKDNNAGANDATATGSPTYDATNREQGTHALALNGSTQHLSLDALANDLAGSTYWGFSAWVKSPASTAARALLSVGDTSGDNKLIVAVGGGGQGSNELGLSDSGTWKADTNTTVADDAWHHVVYVRRGSTQELWIDGVLKASAPASFSLASTDRWRLGVQQTGATTVGNHLGGSIDDLQVFSGVVTADQIVQRANLGSFVARYAFESTVNDTNSPPLNHGVAIGSLGYPGLGDRADGNNSLYLSGTGAGGTGVDISSVRDDLDGNDFTFSVWVKAFSTGAAKFTILAVEKSASDVSATPEDKLLLLLGGSAGGNRLYLVDSGADKCLTSAVLGYSWNHVAFVRSGSDLRLYVNGSLAATASTAAYALNSTGDRWTIGQQSVSGAAGDFFKGFLDDARVYNGALSAADIQQVVNEGQVQLFNASPSTTLSSANNVGADGAYELGMRFRTNTAGKIYGLRVFRPYSTTSAFAAGPTTYTLRLWRQTGGGTSAAGTELRQVSVTFSSTTGGWGEAILSAPVNVVPGETYVVSYGVAAGQGYWFTHTGLQSAIAATGPSPLFTQASSVEGNGVYATTPGSFPNQSFNNSNYWTDVRFSRE